tara:strand:- start:16 stop:351 length:336 start_codon:yes stop_codon:yes gene_type:complete
MANINKSPKLHNYSVQENLSASFTVEYITSADATPSGTFATGANGVPRGVVVAAEIGGSGDLTITFGDDSTSTMTNAQAKNIFLKGAILPLAIKKWQFDSAETAFALMAMF